MKKRKSVEVTLFIVSFITALLLSNTMVLACSCAMSSDPKAALAKADAVFIGEVIEVEELENFQHKTTFRIVQLFKGPAKEFLELVTLVQGPACGITFDKNETYVVYAYEVNGEFRTSICSRTKKLSQATHDIEALQALVTSPATKIKE